MRPMHIVFLFFLVVPFVEIYLLLQVGSLIGPLPTILMVVFTAVLGAALLRLEGFATWRRFQETLARGELPAYEIIEGPIILVGAALLLTPGFVTDILGVICLVPTLRRKIALWLVDKYLFPTAARNVGKGAGNAEAIEGEFRREE